MYVLGWLCFASLLLFASPAFGLTADEILVVANQRSPVSRQVADAYRQARGIPSERVMEIATDPVEEIDRATFTRDIERPIAEYLVRHRLVDRVLAIVLTKDVPLKIRGTSGLEGSLASVDSELTLLYRVLVHGPAPPEGRVPNPYFRPDTPAVFARRDLDIYMVTRLDGYTLDDVRALITRGLARPATSPRTVVLEPRKPGLRDLVGRGTTAGNEWLDAAKSRLKAHGMRVVVREGGAPVAGVENVVGYAGWGSNDPAIKARTPRVPWAPGAIGAWFVSTSARTFKPPPAGWTIGSWNDPKTFHAGSPQSLIGDLVAEGVTGAAGSVYEPYLDATARPDVYLPAYTDGYTLAESFYMALPYLSWQAVVIGDPLAAPFGPIALRATPVTGVSVFLQRRARALEQAPGTTGNRAATRALTATYAELALESLREQRVADALGFATHAVEIGPHEPEGFYALGAVHEARGDHHKAEEMFRKVIAADPRSPLAERAAQRLRK